MFKMNYFLGQNLMEFAQKEYNFLFMIIPNDKNSISSNYHATFFKFNADSTFEFGLSEAVESGKILPDSTLGIQLYSYNQNDSIWAKSYQIAFCDNDYLVLKQFPVNFNNHYPKYKGFGTVLFIYLNMKGRTIQYNQYQLKKIRNKLNRAFLLY